MILEKIHSPADVKALPAEQLPQLCQELRTFLVEQVSKTGGHLSSNLGAVELTVALHRVFDTEVDRLVFDVGHQSYVHKALTGRQELFSTLRQLDGLSGFPKPHESVHDAFIAGHASNSVSVALGMARARTLQKQDHHVLALIGDGALTGGLAYEGLNNAGASGEKLIVLLNDNGMSINPNVGAMPGHLAGLRSRPAYYHFKKWYRSLFGKQPASNCIYRLTHQLKSVMKKTLLPGSSLFEEMGFAYLGPIDGHDLPRLCDMLQWAKEQDGPVVVHVYTEKGKGFGFTEVDPGKFHGIGPFDPLTGETPKGGKSFSAVFGEALLECAAEDEKICAITAAMGDGTGLTAFAECYPERFFDVAIAEGHGVSMAAGLAAQGMTPVFAVYSTFLQRGYDMLIHDVALEQLHVVLGVDRAGLVGADGETHHGTFDVPFLSGIPGFTVLCPANFAELRTMVRQAVFETEGPVAVRYPRGGEGAFRDDTADKPAVLLRTGKDAVIVTYGIQTNQALAAADLLAEKGMEVSVLKLNRISPLDGSMLEELIGKTDMLIVAEDCCAAGCVGQQINALLTARGIAPGKLILKNLEKTFAPAGSVSQLEQRFGLDAAGIAAAVWEAKEHG